MQISKIKGLFKNQKQNPWFWSHFKVTEAIFFKKLFKVYKVFRIRQIRTVNQIHLSNNDLDDFYLNCLFTEKLSKLTFLIQTLS